MIEIIKKEYHRRIIEEGYQRIIQCADLLSEEDLWYRANQNTNSIANLIMHLSGNVRQYIISGIGHAEDNRQRDLEFDFNNRKDRIIIINELKETVEQSNVIVSNLSMDQLTESRKVQGFDETVLSIIIHVVEHFSYHVGQITYFTKAHKDIDTGYYAGLDLNIT